MSEGTETRAEAIRVYSDIGFTVRLMRADDYADVIAKFQVFDVAGWDIAKRSDDLAALPGTYETPLYEKRGAADSSDMTANLDEAEPVVEARIKWDGCSDWWWSEYTHWCRKESVDGFTEALQRLWAWAKELGMDRLEGAAK